ncbi:cell wall serine-threonine-rich galactomanno Mp1 [Cordyceps militaris]|uniref:Cell wall serine-threonine-rich galactomanno Mp1 n=1 Tax=Cordyceps militaris TaxID=73501 RepID=A0A2H4SDZ0_CORMI|nr:cell wall serine-threonine-rich galactomanno Mp1 [Cordyceps militaris]
MKFITLALVSTATAAMVARDATVVKAVMSTIGTDLDAVKTAADAYKGDKTDLVKAADQLVANLKDGKTKVEAGPDLTINDAVELGTAVTSLTKSGTALTDSLTARKSEVEKAGECKTVQDQIASISENSKSLIDTVTKKVPESAQAIAASLAGQLTAVLQKAEDSYKDCQNSGNSASSSSAASSAASSSASSAASSPAGPSGSATSTATGTGSATKTGTGSVTATQTSSKATATGTGGVTPTSTHVTVPTGAAALYAPAGILAAVAAALAL